MGWALACGALAGCAALLPAASIDTRAAFDSFEAAEAALARVLPYRNFGGERQISRLEKQVNPLGALQGAGEIAAGNLVKK